MKRTISLLLAMLSLTACGGEGNTVTDTSADASDSTTEAETTAAPDRLDELGSRDFEGKTFTILDGNCNTHLRANIPGPEMNGDIVNDALFQRDSALEERYNLNIEYEQLDRSSHTTFQTSVLAGDDSYQMLISTLSARIAPLTTQGIFANMADSEYLSLDQNWWSKLMYESFSINGKTYTTTGDIVPSMYQLPACMFLNTDMAKDYKVETDFVQLVRDGEWTLDVLLEATKDITRDVNNDGKMEAEVDIFGISHAQYAMLFCEKMAVSAGVEMSSITDGGKGIKVDLANENTIEVIEKLNHILVKEILYEDAESYITSAFAEDRALFTTHYTESATSFIRTSGMESNYLILPMPKADEAQETYISPVNPWIEAFIGLSSMCDLDFAGFVTEAMAFYSYKNIRPLAYELTYDTKTARDERTAEMLDIIFNTTYVDLNMVYDFGKSRAALLNAFNGNSITTEIAQIQGAIDGDIAKFIENWG